MGRLATGLLMLVLIALVAFQAWQTNELRREVRALRVAVENSASHKPSDRQDKTVQQAVDRVQRELADTRKFIENRLRDVYRPQKEKTQ